MELAAEGGYDAVQMREVAERADVALGTLYRYFPSKVHLLVAAMGGTFRTLQEGSSFTSSATPVTDRAPEASRDCRRRAWSDNPKFISCDSCGISAWGEEAQITMSKASRCARWCWALCIVTATNYLAFMF